MNTAQRRHSAYDKNTCVLTLRPDIFHRTILSVVSLQLRNTPRACSLNAVSQVHLETPHHRRCHQSWTRVYRCLTPLPLLPLHTTRIRHSIEHSAQTVEYTTHHRDTDAATVTDAVIGPAQTQTQTQTCEWLHSIRVSCVLCTWLRRVCGVTVSLCCRYLVHVSVCWACLCDGRVCVVRQ